MKKNTYVALSLQILLLAENDVIRTSPAADGINDDALSVKDVESWWD
ncbi:MAG: hypothetical protein IJ506_01330 [Clostridia bacterium]|nr:hypothetical protein [Clostridia bacterium]MBQ8657754.1 hypothetical protein [Clostridia bacterium]